MVARGKCRIVAAALGVLLALAMGAGSAWAKPSGIVPRLSSARMVAPEPEIDAAARGASSVQPATGVPCGNPEPCDPPLLYGGGPVMHSVTTHVIAWAPSRYQFPADGYLNGYEQYLNDMSHDVGLSTNISSVASQYVDAKGSALGSLDNAAPIVDTTQYPSSGCTVISGASECLSEQQIIAELENQIAANSLPVDLSQSYVVLLPPNVDTCDDSGTECADSSFCGYHDSFYTGSGQTTFTLIPYTGAYYPSSSGSCTGPYAGPDGMSSDLAALDSVGAHELIESATDPLGTGYLDAGGNEVADECAWIFDPVSTASGGGDYNQIVHTDDYLIQDMWSDQDNACVQGDSSPATATVTSSGTPEQGSPTSLGVTLIGATGVSYEWSYASSSGYDNQDVASGANPQITFPVAGTYTVWVEVTDNTGGTVTGVTSVTVDTPPRASFFWSPTSPAAKSSVTFSPSASAGAGSITAYDWSFGDGGSSTAASPSYSYASAGTYTVTLTVTQTDGLTASAQQNITVTAPAVVATPVLTPAPLATPAPAPVAATVSELRSWLRNGLGAPARQLRISRLLKANGVTVKLASVAESGRITISWYTTIKHQKVVVAHGAANVTAGVAGHVKVRLTAAGRRLLRGSRRLEVTVLGYYKYGNSIVTASRKLTLRR